MLELEWIVGKTLLDSIRASSSPLREETVLPWMKQVCEGMAEAAAVNVIHRNLKPGNIILDNTGVALVDNWDCATFPGDRSGPVGTRQYMPPEQAKQRASIDSRSDIYGFGATFYHALQGIPFSEDPDRPRPDFDQSTWLNSLSPTTARLLRRCLADQPELRFQSFAELRTQLESPAKRIQLQAALPELPGYRTLSHLGEGGMGTVYKARSLASEQLVAIKFINPFLLDDLQQLARFRIEAEAVACLRHENIVPVLAVGVFRGRPYLVLEYVPNGNLRDATRTAAPSPAWSAKVVAAVARGLGHSHRLGILHRDLKPQNILLGADGTPRITDFGLAKFTVSGEDRRRLWGASILPAIQGSLMELDRFTSKEKLQDEIAEATRDALAECNPQYAETITEDMVREFVTCAVADSPAENLGGAEAQPTEKGDILGTPAYMAPEQTIGDITSYGPHTDIYSLGVVLYEMLCGRLPHAGKSIPELFDCIRTEAPKPMRRRTPPTLAAICSRCLAKKPDERYSSAVQLAEELEQFADSAEGQQTRDRRWWHVWR